MIREAAMRGGGAQSPVLRVNERKTTGLRRAAKSQQVIKYIYGTSTLFFYIFKDTVRRHAVRVRHLYSFSFEMVGKCERFAFRFEPKKLSEFI
jgi:hypothetical protein